MTTTATSYDREFLTLLKEADRAFRDEDLSTCRKLYHQALIYARARFSLTDPHIPRVMVMLGEVSYRLGHIAIAEPLLRRAAVLIASRHRDDLRTYSLALRTLAYIDAANGLSELAALEYRTALEALTWDLGADHPTVRSAADMLDHVLSIKPEDPVMDPSQYQAPPWMFVDMPLPEAFDEIANIFQYVNATTVASWRMTDKSEKDGRQTWRMQFALPNAATDVQMNNTLTLNISMTSLPRCTMVQLDYLYFCPLAANRPQSRSAQYIATLMRDYTMMIFNCLEAQINPFCAWTEECKPHLDAFEILVAKIAGNEAAQSDIDALTNFLNKYPHMYHGAQDYAVFSQTVGAKHVVAAIKNVRKPPASVAKSKPESAKPEATMPESAKPDSAKPESAKPEAPPGSAGFQPASSAHSASTKTEPLTTRAPLPSSAPTTANPKAAAPVPAATTSKSKPAPKAKKPTKPRLTAQQNRDFQELLKLIDTLSQPATSDLAVTLSFKFLDKHPELHDAARYHLSTTKDVNAIGILKSYFHDPS